MRTKISDTLALSKDSVYNLPIITVVGSCEMYIENYQSIVKYDKDLLKIRVQGGMVIIQGKNLDIEFFDSDEIAVKGCIEQVAWS